MQELVMKVKSAFLSKDFIKFLVVGVVNTFNGTLFSYIYSLVINPNIAFIGGYITSLGIAYILNSKFIFYKPLKWKALIKFAISYIPNFIIQNIVVMIVYNLLALPSVIAYGLAAIIGIPITFIFVKLFAFGEHKKL